MKKYVSTDYTGCNYIAAGKLYKLKDGGNVIDDEGDEIRILVDGCMHLKGNAWTIHEVGTLAELDVKAGDVVEFVEGVDGMYKDLVGTKHKVESNGGTEVPPNERGGFLPNNKHVWRIISRATTADTPQPTPFGKLTDAEQAALLLAHHRGERIECRGISKRAFWQHINNPSWQFRLAYRIAPAEPKRETHAMYSDGSMTWHTALFSNDTHRITLDTVGGVLDCESIKMEKLT